ncbi:MAG TPA: hypothetical protein VJ908_12045 [Wenzhouxiangellaceae bacterium]|nr:hypothetical protein [Wenzhouxiangellaceae bacterium]
MGIDPGGSMMHVPKNSRAPVGFVALALAVLLITGCATVIPEVDTTPPRVELRISGEGVGSETMSNPPRESWTAPDETQYLDLLPGTEYRFTFTVSDSGGVARATLAFISDIEVVAVEPDDVIVDEGSLVTRLTQRGDRGDPRTALVISGRLLTPRLAPSQATSFTFEVESSDFGGRSGRDPNQTFMSVNTLISEL